MPAVAHLPLRSQAAVRCLKVAWMDMPDTLTEEDVKAPTAAPVHATCEPNDNPKLACPLHMLLDLDKLACLPARVLI